jgi:hypothetical protein
MIKKYRYSTVMDAIAVLKQDGFDKDFKLEGDHIISNNEQFEAEDLKILVVYRYEGNSDPGDEATVYGLETNDGQKGILVMADGIYADVSSTLILKKLHHIKNKGFHQRV